MIGPSYLVELFEAVGFRLVDEPGCGLARMTRVVSVSVNRVPVNRNETLVLGQKNAPGDLCRVNRARTNELATHSDRRA